MNLKVQNTYVSKLRGLKQNLEIGRNVLNEFNQKHTQIKSDSFVRTRVVKAKEKGICSRELMQKLSRLLDKYKVNVDKNRAELRGFYDGYGAYVKKLNEVVGKNGFADCGECSDMLNMKLSNKRLKTSIIEMEIKDKNTGVTYKDHVFPVFGFKKAAELTNPGTWGGQTVIVDGLHKRTFSAADGIQEYKQIMGYDPEKHNIIYRVQDPKKYSK